MRQKELTQNMQSIIVDLTREVTTLEERKKGANWLQRWQINRQIAALRKQIERDRQFVEEIVSD